MCGCRDRMVAISEGYRGWMGLSATLLTFLLFAEHGLLFALSFFEASHEAGFLFRLFGGFCHLCAHLVFGDKFAEDVGLDDSDEEREEVVVAQTGSIVVEDEEEHDGHEIHHPLHSGHSR